MELTLRGPIGFLWQLKLLLPTLNFSRELVILSISSAIYNSLRCMMASPAASHHHQLLRHEILPYEPHIATQLGDFLPIKRGVGRK